MSDFTTWRSLVDGEEIGVIPDTSVSRDEDNGGSTEPAKTGIIVSSEEEWPEFDGRLSQNTSGVTEAFIEVKDESEPDDRGKEIGSVDISGLSAGDVFTVDLDENMVEENDYFLYVWAEGDDYEQGFNDSPDLPYESDDGNLSIVDGAEDDGPQSGAVYNVVEVGNLSQ